jgi:hypothetical protein
MKFDGDVLAGIRPAPNSQWGVPLQDHVIGKEARQANVCPSETERKQAEYSDRPCPPNVCAV